MRLSLTAALILLLQAALSGAEVAKSADTVADAVGVNIHLDFGNTNYGYFPGLTTSLLSTSGIRYYRAGMTVWDQDAVNAIYNRLGALGLKGDYIFQSTDSVAKLQTFVNSVHNVAAFEYQNELDNNGNPAWPAQARALGSTFYPAIHQLLPSVPVVGPSLVYSGSSKQLGVVPMDANNLHFYVWNYPPDIDYAPGSAASMDAGQGPCMQNSAGGWDCFPGLNYAMDNAAADSPAVQFWITETGYRTSGDPFSVPVTYEPSYFTREVLWALKNNVPKVFFYELLDEQFSGTYGMVDAQMQPKPGFEALSSLVHLMADPGTTPFTPGNLDYTLTGGDHFIKHALFQKRDGTFYLVVWQACAEWDGKQDITPPAEPMSLSVSGKAIATLYTMQKSGDFAASTVGSSSTTINVGTQPIFIAIR